MHVFNRFIFNAFFFFCFALSALNLIRSSILLYNNNNTSTLFKQIIRAFSAFFFFFCIVRIKYSLLTAVSRLRCCCCCCRYNRRLCLRLGTTNVETTKRSPPGALLKQYEMICTAHTRVSRPTGSSYCVYYVRSWDK